MEVEDLILEDDPRGYFENMSDLDAFIVVGVEDGDIFFGCAVNPDIDPGREFDALGWCAQLVTRIENGGCNDVGNLDDDASRLRSSESVKDRVQFGRPDGHGHCDA